MNDFIPKEHINSVFDTKFLIGEIIFEGEYININEAEVKDNKRYNPGGNIGECKIEVYGGEGDIPHFHIFNKNGSFDTCIKIYSAEYFHHEGHIGVFDSSKDRKELDKWLRKRNKILKNSTNWEIIVYLWESANPNCSFPILKKTNIQPDYSKLK